MKDLRLIGVHEDGEHMLLSDADGVRYRVQLDEAMRAAARRDRPRLGQLQIEIDGGLRPRDVQALIRSGLSTEEVADRAGWTVEKVQRFEGPVLAEREYVANLAKAVVVGSGRGASRRGSGAVESDQTLGARADERFKARGVPEELIRWDSLRLDDGRWTVQALFPAGGRERTASWTFDPRLKSLMATNDEARWLSEDASGDMTIPTPHVATSANRASAVFDVESYGDDEGPAPLPEVPQLDGSQGGAETEASADADAAPAPKRGRRATSREPIDLMAAMREQSNRSRRSGKGRGRSRKSSPAQTPGDDAPREDALPLEELTMDPVEAPEPPAARGSHPESAHLDERAPADSPDTDVDARVGDRSDADADRDVRAKDDEADSGTTDLEDAEDEAADSAQPSSRRGGSRKSGRPSVPSWDDIMFGGGRGKG